MAVVLVPLEFLTRTPMLPAKSYLVYYVPWRWCSRYSPNQGLHSWDELWPLLSNRRASSASTRSLSHNAEIDRKRQEYQTSSESKLSIFVGKASCDKIWDLLLQLPDLVFWRLVTGITSTSRERLFVLVAKVDIKSRE